MISAISLMRRREDVSLTDFRRHWLDVHGPLVCKFAGLHHYVQDHVIESSAMNAAARAMRIDGFPILLFADDTERRRAHGSPEMAACNIDSRSFIGAVSRVICEQDVIIPTPPSCGPMRLIALLSGDAADDAAMRRYADRARTIPGLRGLTLHRVLQQGPAPNSTVPHLPVSVAGIAVLSFASLVDLECSVPPDANVAHFVTEEHRLH